MGKCLQKHFSFLVYVYYTQKTLILKDNAGLSSDTFPAKYFIIFKQIQTYRNRLSGPVQDRIDILLSLKSINLDQPAKVSVTSTEIRKRVENARLRQFERYQSEITNAKVSFEQITQTCPLTSEQQRMLTNVAVKQYWSNRAQIKIIRLARTISDLAGESKITDHAIWKAMTLRRSSASKPISIARETQWHAHKEFGSIIVIIISFVEAIAAIRFFETLLIIKPFSISFNSSMRKYLLKSPLIV